MEFTEKVISECLQKALQEDGKHNESTANKVSKKNDLKCAAVIVPLFRINDEWNLLFTHRTERVEHHKGQVSFPGGACEDNDSSPEKTALREANEEIGILEQDIKVLGIMRNVITITGYRITPVVGVLPWPYSFTPAPAEVSRLFSVPLKWISDFSNWEILPYKSSESSSVFSVIQYHPYAGEVIWGATAQILHNFLSVIGLLK